MEFFNTSFLLTPKIKKGRMRDYILACIDIINAPNEQAKKQLIIAASLSGIFRPGMDTSSFLMKAILQDIPTFRTEVLSLIEIIDTAESEITITTVYGWSSLIYDNDGHYLNDEDGGKKTIFYSETPQLQIVCEGTTLFSTYFAVLGELALLKYDSRFCKVPIKICKECGDVFLGRTLSQQFCSKLHGNRWRAREAYKAKKIEKEKSAQ